MKTIIFILLLTFTAHAETITGKCSKAYDGDTIHVMQGTTKHKIRLAGIDTPEIKQAHGIQSRDVLRGLVLGSTIRVEWSKKDRYGRIIGTVFENDKDINLVMLQNGCAWHYLKYSKDKTYAAAETKAKFNKLGLWASDNAVAPWIYRKKK